MPGQVAESALSATDVAGRAVAEGAAMAGAYAPSYSWTGYFMSVALMCLMLGLLWFGARFIKQKGGLRFLGMTANLNVESRLSIGPRKHILVVRYRGRRLLLGVTEHNINLLSDERLSEDELEAAGAGNGAEASGGLAKKFKEMLHDSDKHK